MTNRIRKTLSFLGAALMATQLIGATTADSARVSQSSAAFEQAMPATPAQKEVEKLLKQISSSAVTLGNHSDRLESYTRGSRLNYETHAGELTRVKETINSMGSDFWRLQELRPSALPWQQLVIDRLEPVLVGLAGHATNAIEQLNEDRNKLPSQEYRDSIISLDARARQVRNIIVVHLDYADSREKLNRLDASAIETVATASPAREGTEAVSKPPKSLEQRVRSELLKLPYYGVFDYLAFEVDGDQITLDGQVSWPTLKGDAERAVRGVEGVNTVISKIEVMPLSPNDDRIRIAAYRAIYGHSALVRYHLNPHPPIRIIVKNGNLTLMGMVGSDLDRTVAHMQANSVPGVFSVTNNLQVGN
jgi:hyperosmotically inducible periplasmic protein